jgi:hypothetical protein
MTPKDQFRYSVLSAVHDEALSISDAVTWSRHDHAETPGKQMPRKSSAFADERRIRMRRRGCHLLIRYLVLGQLFSQARVLSPVAVEPNCSEVTGAGQRRPKEISNWLLTAFSRCLKGVPPFRSRLGIDVFMIPLPRLASPPSMSGSYSKWGQLNAFQPEASIAEEAQRCFGDCIKTPQRRCCSTALPSW